MQVTSTPPEQRERHHASTSRASVGPPLRTTSKIQLRAGITHGPLCTVLTARHQGPRPPWPRPSALLRKEQVQAVPAGWLLQRPGYVQSAPRGRITSHRHIPSHAFFHILFAAAFAEVREAPRSPSRKHRHAQPMRGQRKQANTVPQDKFMCPALVFRPMRAGSITTAENRLLDFLHPSSSFVPIPHVFREAIVGAHNEEANLASLHRTTSGITAPYDWPPYSRNTCTLSRRWCFRLRRSRRRGTHAKTSCAGADPPLGQHLEHPNKARPSALLKCWNSP